MGITILHHRTRLMTAVSELLIYGATEVYIRAARMGWRILGEKDKRLIPRNLLKKMVKMKLQRESISLTDYPLQSVRRHVL